MADLIVVGGGYWGVAIAYKARERGLSVLLFDDRRPEGSSRNSAGMMQRYWYKASTTLNHIPRSWGWWRGPSLGWLESLGMVQNTGEMFATRSRPEARFRDDLQMVDPEAVLGLFPAVRGRVDRICREGGRWSVQVDGMDFPAASVAVAAGAWTDALLNASDLPAVGVQGLRGRAVILDQTAYVGQVPLTYMPKPYTHYTLRPWGNHWRFGDTVEAHDNHVLDRWLMPTLTGLIGQYTYVAMQDGIRPVCKQFVVEEIAPKLVVATGGHRVGLGMAEPVAGRVLDLLQ